jgi:Tfp pilus assembly protein PilE
MNSKGISIITLVITIILIVILASITAPLLSNVISDSLIEDVKVEIKNVETVIGYAKTQILKDDDPQLLKRMFDTKYLITEYQLESKFAKALDTFEMEKIESVNSSDEIKAPYKYYLMKESDFYDVFGSGININGGREEREFLINYMNGIVVVNVGGRKVSNGNEGSISPEDDITRGKVYVEFEPNGNSEWGRQQSAKVFIRYEGTTEPSVKKYKWVQGSVQPSKEDFEDDVENDQLVSKNDVTGNNWYLWVMVEYKDDGKDRVGFYKSEAFYIDNEEPTFDLDVDEIKK